MREEIKNWWEQAKHDLKAAKKNLEIKEYYLVAFLSQQAVEKGLKALIMLKSKERIIPIHSLVKLGKKVNIDKKLLTDLRILSPEYIITRYPDVVESVPHENYDQSIAKDRIKRAERIFKWLNTQIKE
ncbi:HEPN domain-containing protein [Candidatus Woesearchaeota archaeon]|nr:HEPN domain-containing protein [Candidatus Woesearchaeota archaeon]